MNSTLCFTNVDKVFRQQGKEIVALDDLSFALGEGKVVGLLGPNGSGKTTTIKISCGLLTADAGQVQVCGQDVRRLGARVTQYLGVMLDASRGLYQNLTVLENIMFWGTLKGVVKRSQLLARAEKLLAFFDLTSRKNMLTSSLSQGMKQKLGLCCALITEPPLLLLDEPTNGMDVSASDEFVELLRGLCQESGCSVLVTSHQLDVMEELCDEVIIINEGRLMAQDSIDNLRWIFRQRDYSLSFLTANTEQVAMLTGTKDIAVDESTGLTHATISGLDQRPSLVLGQALELGLEIVKMDQVQPSLKAIYQEIVKKGKVMQDE